MDELHMTHIMLHRYHSSPSYSERETAVASRLSIGAIRHLHALGLIDGQEAGDEVYYNQEAVVQLRRIRRLQRDLGINLAGVEVILHLRKRVETLQYELEQERNRVRGSSEQA